MKLNYKRTILVGFAFFLISAFWQAYDAIVPLALTNHYGLPQTVSGVIMSVDNVLAVFMLPLFGAISDRVCTRFGKRTPFVVIGTVAAILSFILLSVVNGIQINSLAESGIIETYNNAANLFSETTKALKESFNSELISEEIYLLGMEKAEAAFEANNRENLDYIKANLPSEILEKVADIRVLALGSASPEVTDAITRFCGGVNRRCEKVAEEYHSEVEKLADKLGWEKINMLNRLLNSAIELCQADENGNFAFATSAEYTDVPCRVDLIGAKVITCDDGLVGSAVANIEILPSENGTLVFSALCQKLDGTMIEFSAEAQDIEVI